MRAEIYFFRVRDHSDLVYRSSISEGDKEPTFDDLENFYEHKYSFENVDSLKDVFKRCWMIFRKSNLLEKKEKKRPMRSGDIVYLDGKAYIFKENKFERYSDLDIFSSECGEEFEQYIDKNLQKKMAEARKNIRQQISNIETEKKEDN